jgi:hypothetical protein
MNEMAKETKAERMAREEVVRQAMLEEQEASYPNRLMAVLQRAQHANFEMAARNDMTFSLFDLDKRDRTYFEVDFFYSTDAESDLDDLSWAVKWKEEERAEAERKYLVRQNALAKLSQEEKELLNLQ